MPPRIPAHVKNGTLRGAINCCAKGTSVGSPTATKRAAIAIGIAAAATSKAAGSNLRIKTSRPISRNRTELRISSIKVQRPNTYVCVWSLMAS